MFPVTSRVLIALKAISIHGVAKTYGVFSLPFYYIFPHTVFKGS